MDLVSAVRCHVEVSAMGRSLFQRSPTDCDVSECDCEASMMRMPWPTRGLFGNREKSIARGVAMNVTLMANTLDAVLVNTRYYRCTFLDGPCKTHERHELQQLVTVSKFELTPLHV